MKSIPQILNKYKLKQQLQFYEDQIDKDKKRMIMPSAGEESQWKYKLFGFFWRAREYHGSKCKLFVSLDSAILLGIYPKGRIRGV